MHMIPDDFVGAPRSEHGSVAAHCRDTSRVTHITVLDLEVRLLPLCSAPKKPPLHKLKKAYQLGAGARDDALISVEHMVV